MTQTDADTLLFKKSTLSLGGAVRLPEGYVLPVRISHSTAGPGAGNDTVAFSFDGMRVKKGVSYQKGEFELVVNPDGTLSLTHGGEPFIDRVKIEPVAAHCPEQAFFTIDQRCIYGCAFCNSPRLPPSDYKGLTPERMVERTRKAMEITDVKSIALTSGVVGSPQETVDRFVECVKAFKQAFPELPLGVEPYLDDPKQVHQLKDAGADEIKLNIQCATRAIMDRVCPDLDYDLILGNLREAVEVFGRGKVTSNIIYGLGETEDELVACLDMLCEMGVVPTVRGLRRNPMNSASIVEAIGDVPRINPEMDVGIAHILRRELDRYGMRTDTFDTMCLACRCCDLVPFRDFRGGA